MRLNSTKGIFVVAFLFAFLSEGFHAIQITDNAANQINPAVYKGIIVWEDDRNDNWDIYGYASSAGGEIEITTDVSNQYDPALYESIVVWMDERNGNYDIYGYDLSLLQEFQITDNVTNQIDPALHGDIVVWQDYRNGNWDIYGYRLATHEEFQITDNVSNQIDPALSNEYVVWQDYRNGNWDIYGYDLSLSQEFQITTDAKDQMSPKIYGDTVVWTDNRNGNYDIYGFNLSLSQEFQITDNVANQMNPAVYRDVVVWEDDRNGNYDIYGYNSVTHQEFQIETNDALQRNPAVYEDTIVWEDNRNDTYDIYKYVTTTFTVTVSVTDVNGNPVPGASVVFGPYTGTTDETGIVSIAVAPGTYTLTVSAPGYQENTQQVHITGNQSIDVTLVSELIASDLSVAITVKDAVGKGVEGAAVTLAGAATYTGTTDVQGDAVFFNVSAGEYTLSVSAAGYQEWVQPLQVTEDKIVTVTLVSDVSVTVTVHNASQTPVAGAVVTMTGAATYFNTTGAQGMVTFTEVVHGVYTLTVSHAEYGTYSDPSFTVSTTKTIVVTLNPEMGFIHGLVYWETTETPAQRVTVHIYDQTTGVLEKKVVTDFEGRFFVEVSRTERYSIIVEDFADQKYVGIAPVNSLGSGAVTLIIDPQSRVKGVVTDESGKELAGAAITIKDAREQVAAHGTTDNAGLFTIKVTPGTYSLEITKSGYQIFTQTFTVSHKEIYNLGYITVKKKPDVRIDVPEESPPVDIEPPSESLMIPVLITLGVCILVVILLVIRAENRSDLATIVLISVFTGVIAIILMWILFQIS